MPDRVPQVGDPLFYKGARKEILAFPERARLVDGKAVVFRFVVFGDPLDRSTFTTGNFADLAWFKGESAWVIPGMILSPEQVDRWKDLTGSSMNPPAEKHVEVLAFLRAVGSGLADMGLDERGED